MTLDEAIIRCKHKAKENKLKAKDFLSSDLSNDSFNNTIRYKSFLKCAEDNEQLAKWLMELKRLRKNNNGRRRKARQESRNAQ